MKNYSYLSREDRISKALENRNKNLVLVLENLSEELNISAILRTTEGFGIGRVFIINSAGKRPRLSSNVSSGASKWLDITYYSSSSECLSKLKEEGFIIYGTYVNPTANNLLTTRFEGRIALVMGNESQGISEEVINLADHLVYLPMQGLTESFNVSVAAALFLYEILRQRYGQKDE